MNAIRFHRSISKKSTTWLARYFHASHQNLGVIKPFLLADIGEGITDCEVVQWFVKPGDTVNEFDRICEVQSDKASVEISSRYAGKISKIYYEKHQVAKVGQPLVDIETDQQEDDAVTESPSSSKPGTTKTAASVRVSDYKLTWQTPAVRRLLGEYGLNVEDISGSGKNGLVLKEDVLKMISEGSLKRVEKKQALEVKKVPLDTAPGDRTVPLTNIQKTMFKTMTDALSIPQLGYKDEIVLNATSEYRKALNEYIQQHTNKFPFKKISYLPIIIKSMSLSLSYFPLLNAKLVTLDDGSTKIQYRDYHHIGIAMDTPQGLIVPNIKHVEKKTIFEIAHEIHRLTDLAKKGALPPADLKGGTITISNIGSIGGTFANPVIVPNELAIVALGTARKLPRFDTKSNALIPQQILPVSWSADHRIIDGATIAQFGNTWKKFIENPAILASELH